VLLENGGTLTLPNDDKIRILAVSVVEEYPAVIPAQPLYDRLKVIAPPLPQN